MFSNIFKEFINIICIDFVYTVYIMFKYIKTILTSNNPNLFFTKLTMIMAIILISIIIRKMMINPHPIPEGFSQGSPFVLKLNDDVYDEFYSSIHDTLHDTKSRIQVELIEIIKMTEPSTTHSVFLDVGSGTGNVVDELVNAGYNAYGIEKSPEMVTCSATQHPDIEIVNADVLDAMSFEKSTFTHVLCTYFTIYQFDDKEKFFRNCYYWMKPNSYLILHLVNPKTFKNIVPYKNVDISSTDTNVSHVLNNKLVFEDFSYVANYEVPTTNNERVTFTETFTSHNNNNIRQNEQTMQMESIDKIINMASMNGFIVKGKSNMNSCADSNQFLYILERQM